LDIGFIDHLHTPLGTTLYRSLAHTDLVSSVYSNLHQPFPGNSFYRRRFFSFTRSGPVVTATHAELLSTNNSTNWVPGWRPFHTNLVVFSSQTDFQLTTDLSHSPTSYFTSLHSTALLTTQQLTASNCSAYNILAHTTQKTPFPLL
jgi:hypothetical protein